MRPEFRFSKFTCISGGHWDSLIIPIGMEKQGFWIKLGCRLVQRVICRFSQENVPQNWSGDWYREASTFNLRSWQDCYTQISLIQSQLKESQSNKNQSFQLYHHIKNIVSNYSVCKNQLWCANSVIQCCWKTSCQLSLIVYSIQSQIYSSGRSWMSRFKYQCPKEMG